MKRDIHVQKNVSSQLCHTILLRIIPNVFKLHVVKL